jgi:Xaa-Pro dipeptidase
VDELEHRLTNVRAAAERAGVDAVVVAGSEYTGFEGAVTYLSGFTIVHRYAYVVVPRDGDPAIVFPAEARYVGEHGTTLLEEQVFAPHPGAAEVVPFDEEFDLARAVKSDEELESVRDSVRINTEGFRIFLRHYRPGVSAAEVMAECERYFVEEGCGRLTMDMVLAGPEFLLARKDLELGEFVLPSLEIAGPGGHWVEVSRAIGEPDEDGRRMLEAYGKYFEAAQAALRPGATAHDVHRAVSRGFHERGYHLGHVTGHSIGMTMIEHPKIGEGVETELAENMVFSMHPHAITPDGRGCLYMQETWLVTANGGEPLSGLPMRAYAANETVTHL